MDHYADSSFLVSCYLPDANTSGAKSHLAKIGVALPFTVLHALEVRNAFNLGVFRKVITARQSAMAWADLEADLHKGRLVRTTVTIVAYDGDTGQTAKIWNTLGLSSIHYYVEKGSTEYTFHGSACDTRVIQ